MQPIEDISRISSKLICGFSFLISLIADKAALTGRKSCDSSGRDAGGEHRKRLNTTGGLVFCLLLAIFSSLSRADEPVYEIDIPVMNAAEALNRFAEQTGAIMLFPYDIASAREANAVSGRYTLLAGLELLLQGTGLSGGLSDRRVVNISRAENERRLEGEDAMPKPDMPLGRKIAAFVGSILAVSGASGQENGTGAQPLEEIIVTAQKREQSLQSVPISISAYSGELIEQLNARDFADFADAVPGLAFKSTGLGNSQYIIRGIGQASPFSAGLSPTTGIYLDEVPLQTRTLNSSSQPDPILFDVARVEVLRGPQGVLFGSSAMGGTVRIVTNQPDATSFGSSVDVGFGTITDGDINWDVRGMVNIPIVDDKLALRAVGTRRYDGGWIDDLRPVTADVFENIDNPAAVQEDTNSTDYYMGRVAVSYTPDDTLNITPSILYQRGEQDVDQHSSDVTFGRESRLRARYQDSFTNTDFLIANLSITKESHLFGGVSFLSSTSYLEHNLETQFDSTAFRSAQIASIVGPSPNGELYWSGHNRDSNTKQFTQEFRVVSAGHSRAQYVTGVYYNKIDQRERQFRPANNLFGAVAPLPFGASDPPNLEDAFTDFDQDEIALFGEVSYALSDAWTISIGGRYFDYDQTDSRRNFGVGGESAGDFIFQFSEEAKEDGFTPRVVLSYEPNDKLNLYTSFASGFRTGGANAPIDDSSCPEEARAAANLPDVPPPYESDSTDTFEIGVKTTWLGGRVRANAAVYSIKWDDFQQNVFIPCGIQSVSFTANSGAVESDGAELEYFLRFTDDFQVSGGISYTDAVYKEPFTPLVLPAGFSLLDVPEITSNIRAEYSFPISEHWDGRAMLSANFVGDMETGIGPGETETRPSYAVIDFMATVVRESLSVSFFVDNIADETQIYGQAFATSPSTTTATSFFAAHTGPPRTVGFRIRKGFE